MKNEKLATFDKPKIIVYFVSLFELKFYIYYIIKTGVAK